MREEDKRQFARYVKELLCEITLGSEIFKAKVVDYSDGVGVMIKKNPLLTKGTQVTLRILEYEIEFEAEVTWTEDIGYHQRIGFRRLDSLRGNLKHYRLVDILLGISKSRKTGVLQIIIGSTVKEIYIENGVKIFAVSTDTNDRLGEYLLTQGEITLEEYNQASYLVEKKGKRLGQVLIDLGYMKPSDLAPSVQRQVEEIIMSLFNIDEGRFEFKDGPLPMDEPIKLNISTPNLIYKGIKRINSFPMIDKMCPPIDTVFNLSKNPIPMFKSLTLEYADKKILSNVNGINPLKTILSLSHANNFETLKAVISLYTIGLITIKGADETPAKLPLEIIFGKPSNIQPEEVREGTGGEYKSSFENQEQNTEIAKEEEVTGDALHEPPVQEVADTPQEDKAAASDEGNSEWTVEYTNIVENEKQMDKIARDDKSEDSIPQALDVPESIEETDEVQEAVSNAETVTEETGQVLKDQESSEVIDDIDEASSIAEIVEEAVEYLNADDRNNETTELSHEPEDVTKDSSEPPVENVSEVINNEQPVAGEEQFNDDRPEDYSPEETDEVQGAVSNAETETEGTDQVLKDQESSEGIDHIEEASSIAETSEEAAEYLSSDDRKSEITELSHEPEDVTNDSSEPPVENVSEVINNEQPVAGEELHDEDKAEDPSPVDRNEANNELEETPALANDELFEEAETEVMKKVDQQSTDNINRLEKSRSNKALVISVVVILIVVAVVVPILYKNFKTSELLPSEKTMEKALSLTPVHDKVTEKPVEVIYKSKSPYPSFRGDALNKLDNC